MLSKCPLFLCSDETFVYFRKIISCLWYSSKRSLLSCFGHWGSDTTLSSASETVSYISSPLLFQISQQSQCPQETNTSGLPHRGAGSQGKPFCPSAVALASELKLVHSCSVTWNTARIQLLITTKPLGGAASTLRTWEGPRFRVRHLYFLCSCRLDKTFLQNIPLSCHLQHWDINSSCMCFLGLH